MRGVPAPELQELALNRLCGGSIHCDRQASGLSPAARHELQGDAGAESEGGRWACVVGSPPVRLPAILFLPIIEWGFRRQRPQQLARCFAAAGWRVYYPHLRLSRTPSPPVLVESGVWEITLLGDPDLDPYRRALTAPEAADALASLQALGPDHGLEECWIVVHLPAWRQLAELARSTFSGRLLFDCMDEFSAFGDHGDLAGDELALAETADLVTVTARSLHDKLAPRSRRCVVVPNGCDPEHFGPVVARPGPRKPPVVGFFGGIHDWFDTELVHEVAENHPEWQVWLVGDTYRADTSALRTLPNVTFWGEVGYAELPRLVSCFDVGMIPFRSNALTAATNPVKAWEMLAAGLPVVSTELPELRSLRPWVHLASSPSDFAAAISAALTEPPESRHRRREEALRHSWVERFLGLRTVMDEVAPPDTGAVADVSSVGALQLGLRDRERERLETNAKLAALERAFSHSEAEQARLLAQAKSLIEQRDRVQAEVERVTGELQRAEGARVTLERRLAALENSRWWRLATPWRRLRGRR